MKKLDKLNKQLPYLSELSFNQTLSLIQRVLQSRLGLALQECAVARSKFPENVFAYF